MDRGGETARTRGVVVLQVKIALMSGETSVKQGAIVVSQPHLSLAVTLPTSAVYPRGACPDSCSRLAEE